MKKYHSIIRNLYLFRTKQRATDVEYDTDTDINNQTNQPSNPRKKKHALISTNPHSLSQSVLPPFGFAPPDSSSPSFLNRDIFARTFLKSAPTLFKAPLNASSDHRSTCAASVCVWLHHRGREDGCVPDCA